VAGADAVAVDAPSSDAPSDDDVTSEGDAWTGSGDASAIDGGTIAPDDAGSAELD